MTEPERWLHAERERRKHFLARPISPGERGIRANPVNGSKPVERRACELCVYGRGKHEKWCPVGKKAKP